MKMIISPARRMKTVPGMALSADLPGTAPMFREQTQRLLHHLRQYAPWQLESVFKANQKLSEGAFFDYQSFDFDGGTPALLAYDGLVYKYLDAHSLSPGALDHAAGCLRIASALYALLRPTDLISPYRLEMATKLALDEGSLYDFWGDLPCRALYDGDDCALNLASEEYAKCIRRHLKAGDRFIDVAFLKSVNGPIPTTLAKMARGQMARLILMNKIQNPEHIQSLELDGFAFSKALSCPTRYVFCRAHHAQS